MQHQIPDEIRYLLLPSVVLAHEMMEGLEYMYRQVIDDVTNRAIGLLGVLNTMAYPPPAERPNVWQNYLFELDWERFKDEFCIHKAAILIQLDPDFSDSEAVLVDPVFS